LSKEKKGNIIIVSGIIDDKKPGDIIDSMFNFIHSNNE